LRRRESKEEREEEIPFIYSTEKRKGRGAWSREKRREGRRTSILLSSEAEKKIVLHLMLSWGRKERIRSYGRKEGKRGVASYLLLGKEGGRGGEKGGTRFRILEGGENRAEARKREREGERKKKSVGRSAAARGRKEGKGKKKAIYGEGEEEK